jgi:D-alanyl-D-alanine carboxypeptidase
MRTKEQKSKRTKLNWNTVAIGMHIVPLSLVLLFKPMFHQQRKDWPMHPMARELERLIDAGIPGGFAFVEDASGHMQFFTAGYGDVAASRRMTPDSRYRVGSTTKSFTAVVALQLIAEGRLALTDTLRERLPDLPIPNAGALTIEHLLRMRSGLFDFEDDPSLLGNLEAHLRPTTLRQAIQFGISGPAGFAPGAQYAYCNTNFCILELIIERITGQTLGAELQRRIFGPLHMTDSSYPDEDDLSMPEPYIRGYEHTAGGWRECSNVFFGRGDGALISTAHDLSRFFRALLLDRTLLPADLLRQMMLIVADDPPAEEAYGLGLMESELPCGVAWGHSGGGFGYRHMPYLQIETGRFAIVMLNGTYGFRQPSDPPASEPPRLSMEARATLYCGDSEQ